MALFTYRDLETWQRSMDLVTSCYRLTDLFPKAETYGLTSQIRRAATSVPANLAEGHCRRTTRAYANHVSIALGSHGELATYLELSIRMGLGDTAACRDALALSDTVGRLLNGLYRSLEQHMVAAADASNAECDDSVPR